MYFWLYSQINKHKRELMDQFTKANFEARAKILKALAHPSRLFIVYQLAREEKNVGELASLVGADISTVSRHLSAMKAVGIIEDDKRGAQVYYRLKAPCVLNFFTCLESVMQANVEAQLRLCSRD